MWKHLTKKFQFHRNVSRLSDEGAHVKKMGSAARATPKRALAMRAACRQFHWVQKTNDQLTLNENIILNKKYHTTVHHLMFWFFFFLTIVQKNVEEWASIEKRWVNEINDVICILWLFHDLNTTLWLTSGTVSCREDIPITNCGFTDLSQVTHNWLIWSMHHGHGFSKAKHVHLYF